VERITSNRGGHVIHHPSADLTPEERAHEMWAVHPVDINNLGFPTRKAFYEAHIRRALTHAQRNQWRLEDMLRVCIAELRCLGAHTVPRQAARLLADMLVTDCGHGHVWPNPEGRRARCGGPEYCSRCAEDLRNKLAAEALEPPQCSPAPPSPPSP
jgi:hypothetical protein